jgi:hypothetical protein
MHRKEESKESWDKNYRHHYYFRKGVYKLQEELDVVTMLKSMRRVKLLTATLLTQTQKMILKFQRKNLIESNSSSGDSDTNNKLDSANLLESKYPMFRLVVLSKIKRMILRLTQEPIDVLDKRLIRGLFVRDIRDFDEEYRKKMNNLSLSSRVSFNNSAIV